MRALAHARTHRDIVETETKNRQGTESVEKIDLDVRYESIKAYKATNVRTTKLRH